MNIQKNKKSTYLIVILLLLVIGVSIGYAAITSNLKVNGSSRIESARWGIEALGIGISPSEGVEVVVPPTITENGYIEINYQLRFTAPGQTCDIYFDLVNTGTIDAVLLEPEIVGGEGQYLSTYIDSSGGRLMAGDVLYAGEKRNIVIHTKFLFIDAEELFIDGESQDFGVKLHYEQA